MKDFDSKPTSIEIKEVKEHRKEQFNSEMHSIPGLTLWEYNTVTKVLQAATIEVSQMQVDNEHGFLTPKIMDNNGTVTRKKVLMRADCAYFQSLNFKNALKKVEKNFR